MVLYVSKKFDMRVGLRPALLFVYRGFNMAKAKLNTAQIAAELAEPLLQSMGLRLWDVRFEKEGGGWFLRYFIDKECQIDIAIDMLLCRNTVGNRISHALGRIEKLYRS